jgi:hypothetical protein
MSEILPVGGFAPPASVRSVFVRVEPKVASSPTPSAETVGSRTPSRFDEELQQVLSQTSFRLARLRAVRAEIEAGTYETKERVQGAVGRLIDILR